MSTGDLVWALIYGVRFDLSALAFTLGLWLFVLVFLARSRAWSRVVLWFIVILNTCFFVINFVDTELYNFTAKRFSANSFFLAQEAHFTNLILPYAGLVTSSLLIVGFYWYCSYKLIARFSFSASLKKAALTAFSFLLLSVIGSRGGFQHKPVSFVDAKIFDNSYGNNLVLNSTFTVLKSATHATLPHLNEIPHDQMILNLNAKTDLTTVPDAKGLNIVVMVMESFSKEYMELRDPEVMPYFNSLAGEGVYFSNAFANGRRSIEGIAAILSGIPALMDEPFISSEFAANQVIGLGNILSSIGYETAFFHGAHRGSMHFDSFVKGVGIARHFGEEDFPDSSQYDGTWGIWDEPFFAWSCEKITEFKQPFFSTIFSLSSHHPFALPKQYQDTIKDERLPILKTVKYSDTALKKFMECAQSKPWFKNTLFVFTADHAGPELKPNTDFVSRFSVPIVFYGPNLSWLKDIDAKQPAQHIDLLPTFLDILGVEQKNYNYLARSLLRSGDKMVALFSDGRYELVGDVKDRETRLKAVRQYFSQGMYDNRLYYPVK